MLNQTTSTLSRLLAGTAAALDIPPHLVARAEAEYKAVGHYLTAHETTSTWDVYPQGSFPLGTVVRPIADGDEYDIDLVCLRGIGKTSTTQAALKAEIGRVLRNYLRGRQGASGAPTSCEPTRRAWTLAYRDPFHLDVLPAVPSEEDPPTGIWLTDRELTRWLPSNPKEYVKWFTGQMAQELIMLKTARAQEMRKRVEEIPDYEVKTTLQQVVQVYKRHRDLYFKDRLELRPPSILVTTLLARAYIGHQELADAVTHAATNMRTHIQRNSSGIYVVKSPVSAENFADKWAQYPERMQAFFEWLDDIRRDIDQWSATRGLPDLETRMSARFGKSAVTTAFKSLGVETREVLKAGGLASTGALATLAPTTLKPNPPHTFFGAEHV